jgi:hypothetical protein
MNGRRLVVGARRLPLVTLLRRRFAGVSRR